MSCKVGDDADLRARNLGFKVDPDAPLAAFWSKGVTERVGGKLDTASVVDEDGFRIFLLGFGDFENGGGR